MLENAISLSDNHSCSTILNSEQDWLGEGESLQVAVLPGCTLTISITWLYLNHLLKTVICVWKPVIRPLRLDYFSAWIICLNSALNRIVLKRINHTFVLWLCLFFSCFNRLKLPLFVSLLYNASPCVLPYSPSLTDKTHCASGQTSNVSESMRDAFWKKIFNSQKQQVF